MKICIGVTRRARWQALEETFIVITRDAQNKPMVHLGGWNADGKKFRLELDPSEVARIAELDVSVRRQ